MSGSAAKRFVEELAAEAGVTINGNSPYDLQVKNTGFYQRVLRDGALGVGESYMDGWWDAQALDELVNKVSRINILKRIKGNWKMALHILKAQVFNMQRISRAFQVGEEHYDIGTICTRPCWTNGCCIPAHTGKIPIIWTMPRKQNWI